MVRTHDRCDRKWFFINRLCLTLLLAPLLMTNGLQADYVANSPPSEATVPNNSPPANNHTSADGPQKKLSISSLLAVRDSGVPVAPLDDAQRVYSSEKSPGKTLSDNFETQRLVRETESIEKRADNVSAGSDVRASVSFSPWRTLTSLVVVLVLFATGAFILRRFLKASGKIGKSSGVEILSKNPINARQSVCIMKFGTRVFVLGVSPNHMAALDVIDNPDEVAIITGDIESSLPHSISHSFDKLFQRESRDYDKKATDKLHDAESRSYEYRDPGQIQQAKRELTGLLDKVKGLSRIRRP